MIDLFSDPCTDEVTIMSNERTIKYYIIHVSVDEKKMFIVVMFAVLR